MHFRVQNFGDLATFSVGYCILYSECPPYFYFRFVWPTDQESIPHASTPTLIIPSKFEVDMNIPCRVTAFLSADTSRDLLTLTIGLRRRLRVVYSRTSPVLKPWPCKLDLWPFDLEQLSYMTCHVHNSATKFEDPTTISLWVTSYNVSHWLALKMRTRPLRMRRITWSVSTGSKTITYLESASPICLFAIQLLLGYDDD